MALQPHEQRVVDEFLDLGRKIGKLETFINGPIYRGLDPVDQNLLAEQLVWMRRYKHVLSKRIRRFKATRPNDLGNKGITIMTSGVGSATRFVDGVPHYNPPPDEFNINKESK